MSKTLIAMALDDLAESQNLADEARKLVSALGVITDNNPEVFPKLEVICAVIEKSISLNASASEALQELPDQDQPQPPAKEPTELQQLVEEMRMAIADEAEIIGLAIEHNADSPKGAALVKSIYYYNSDLFDLCQKLIEITDQQDQKGGE
jgi:hypothetical protein